VVVFSLLASAPLALLVPVLPLLAVFPVLALFGLISEMNFYPLVVLAQRALPRHMGFASGVTLGLSIGIGSLAGPLLGLLADSTSLRTALFGAGALTLLAALVSLALPRAAT
jgi:MFS transporter, FSR family, fosmidomycin resistance protein